MRRELGIARCGLACCLCSENADCGGCAECQDKETCENRRCSIERGLESCAACPEEACRKGLLGQLRPRGFLAFVRRYGAERLLDCLEENERRGIVYHRSGFQGDYDGFADAEALISFLLGESKAEPGENSSF